MALNIVGFFCEDIREEKTGQITLIGILPDNISVPPIPANAPDGARARMPKLAVYIRIHISPDENVRSMATKLVLSGGDEISLGEIDAAVIAQAKKEATDAGLPVAGIVHHAIMQGFAIPTPPERLTGILTVDGRNHTFGALRFVNP